MVILFLSQLFHTFQDGERQLRQTNLACNFLTLSGINLKMIISRVRNVWPYLMIVTFFRDFSSVLVLEVLILEHAELPLKHRGLWKMLLMGYKMRLGKCMKKYVP